MKQVIEINKIEELVKYNLGKTIVLVGGCFDILHLGHITFLEKAKEKGDILIVLLESDFNIKNNKGQNRPVNNQENRAVFLSKLKMVDYIVKLPEMKNDQDYFEIINKIKPQIIAVSEEDKNLTKKKNQAKKVGAKLIKVTKPIPYQSTSRIIEIITDSF